MAKNTLPQKYTEQQILNQVFDESAFTIATSASGTATDDSDPGATPGITLVGGEYRSSDTTYTDGDATILQTDINGKLETREQYQPGYEDNTNGVAKVEHQYSPSALLVADGQIKGSAGFIHSITVSCDDAAPTAGSIIVFNSLTETGTEIFNHTFTTTPFMPFTVILDVVCSTGIYAGFTTTADVNLLVSYR